MQKKGLLSNIDIMETDNQNNPVAKHEVENVNLKHHKNLRFQDKIALRITTAIGTMYAVYFFITVMSAWILWQMVSEQPIDPYPFAFLLFLGNIVQLLFLPLILVGQSLQGKHSELRAEEEYKRTLSIYHDMEKIQEQLNLIEEKLDKSHS